MTAKHTSSPWRINDPAATTHVFVDDADNQPVATVWDRANVALVAAAPDLLAACQAAVALESSIDESAWYASSQCPIAFRQLRAAIAKATGVVS